jgi:hypothetical protein
LSAKGNSNYTGCEQGGAPNKPKLHGLRRQNGSKISSWTPYGQSSNLVVARSIRAGGASLFSMDEDPLFLIQILLARLERIPADSVWAHRASGVRGSLLRMLEKSENGHPIQRSELKRMMDLGFIILAKAAEELIQ